jgi:dihydrofolate reductase
MRKVIASMNMTLDGFCNHTASVVTDELHEYFNEEMRNTGAILYGRITYQLMEEAFPALVKNPSGDKPIDEFAVLMDNMPKLVFSKTLNSLTWESATLAKGNLDEEVFNLKQQPGKHIMVGSPSLIAQLTQHNLIDEYRLCIHPIILGSGLVLFKNIQHRIDLGLIKTHALHSGVVVYHYRVLNNRNK